ncbi:MAG: tryptophan--tRNA ligase [Candidatus Paceibacterota bacterium]|jgi:tryptophanyl-tRNA synthetase
MRIFSGIQPTGQIHLGNYLGALKQWVEMQDSAESIFCIVDLHSLTVPYEPKKLRERIIEKAIAYLAAGINPEKSIIFVQSDVKEHTELAWLLNTVTPVGDLGRMTQFKEKSKKSKDNINAGLLNYPILMAADILLYQTDVVPVGEDQKQHVELARTIAKRFNQRFGETFKLPEARLAKSGAKIMSLQDPTKKMSKSDSPDTFVGLFDEPDEIKEKIMRAVTDMGKIVKYDQKKKAGISNLLTIYSLLSGKTVKELEKKFSGKGYADFKKSLVQVVIDYLEPFRKKKKELLSREVYIEEILKRGSKRAENIAQSTMQDVRKKMGLLI